MIGSVAMQSSYLNARKKFAAGDYEQAHAICMSILQEDPRFSDAYYLLSMIAVAYGNYAKAIDVLDRAIGFNATKPEYFAVEIQVLYGAESPFQC